MQLTLRQAHKLVDKIGQRLGTLRISATADVNAYEVTNASQTFEHLKKEFETTVQRQLDLLAARQEVRDGIQKANTVAVDGLVAKRKALLDRLATLRHVLTTVTPNGICTPEALDEKIDAVKKAAAAGGTTYGRGAGDTVAVCVMSIDDQTALDRTINQSQIQLEQIEDELSSANATRSNLVTLSEKTVALLKEEGVI